jgi:predicted nucleotidyltransferase
MSLASALFTDRQARIFKWIFGQPGRTFYLNELLRLTQLGSASLQQELKRLTDAGILISTRTGNLRMFQANPESAVFTELVSLTRKTVGLEALLSDALQPLHDKLAGAWIYGSVAKQTDTSASDVDVMLVGDGLTLGEVLQCLEPLERELGRVINPTCYTVQEFERRKADPDSFVSKVWQQPRLVLKEWRNGS